MGINEVNEAARLIQEAADPEVEIIFGANVEEQMGDAVKVTVIATGFGHEQEDKVVFADKQKSVPKDDDVKTKEKDPFDFLIKRCYGLVQ